MDPPLEAGSGSLTVFNIQDNEVTQEVILSMQCDRGLDSLKSLLDARAQQARVFSWMHGQCAAWINVYALIVSVLQSVLSYTASACGAAVASSSTSNSSSSSLDANTKALVLLATLLSFLVGTVTTLSKLPQANFDANKERHASLLKQWNMLEARMHIELALHPLQEEQDVARVRELAQSSAALGGLVEKTGVMQSHMRENRVKLVRDIETTFKTLEAVSAGMLPLWARKRAEKTWKLKMERGASLPVVCIMPVP